MAEEAKTTETKRTPDISQSELQVAFEFKLENYYQQGNDADKKVAEGILIDELRSFVANFGSEKTLTDALARARETIAGKNEISEARFNLIAGRIQGLYKDEVAKVREESRKKMHDSMRDYSDLLSDETVRRARNPEDQKRKEDMEKAAADALLAFMRRGGDEKAIRETLADIPGVTPHFERRFTALAKMQAAFVNYGETLREHGPSTKKESLDAKREAEAALIKSLRSFAKVGGSTERMDEVLKEIYAEYGTKLEGQGSMTDWFVKKIRGLYAEEVAKEEERKKQKEAEEAAKKAQQEKGENTTDGDTPPAPVKEEPAAEKPAEEKPVEEKPAEEKPAEEKKVEKEAEIVQETAKTGDHEREGGDGTPQGGDGDKPKDDEKKELSWREVFEQTQKHADDFEAAHPGEYPVPRRITEFDDWSAKLESGAKIAVNQDNPNALHITTRPGQEEYLADCASLVHALKLKGYDSVNIREGNEKFVKAMYQAAIMEGMGAKLPKEFEAMAQEWALEAQQMKEATKAAEKPGAEKTGAKKPEGKKPEDKKPEGKKPEDKKPEDKKTAAEKPAEEKPLDAEALAKKAAAEKAAQAAFEDLVFAVQEKGVASAHNSKEAKKFEKAMKAYASYMSPEDVAAFKKSLDAKTPKVDEEHIAAYSHAKKLAFAMTDEAYKNRQPAQTKEPKKAEKEPAAPPTPARVKEAEANAQKAFKAIIQDQHAPEATSKKAQQEHMDAFLAAMKVAVYGKDEGELKQFQMDMQKAGIDYESKQGLREGAAKDAVGLIGARMQGAADYLQKRAKLDEKGKIAQFMGKVQDGLKFKKERAVIESNPLVAQKISGAKGR